MEERLRYLFTQYFENNCTKKELEEFFFYIRQSRYEERLRQMIRKVYGELRDSETFSTFVDEHGRLVLTKPGYFISDDEDDQLTSKPKSYAGAFVAIAILIFAGTIWLVKNREPVAGKPTSITAMTRKTTDQGESKKIFLEDSTLVWLNASSTIEFPDQFDKQRRDVHLSGEAFFDVRKAEKLPFVVHAGSISVTVMSTAFVVKTYPSGKFMVAVSRGKVKISRPGGWEIILEKGDQVKLEPGSNKAIEKTIAVSDVAAWREGYLVYDDETLNDVIVDLERAYNVSVIFPETKAAAQRITSSFRKEIGIVRALETICKTTGLEFREMGNDKYELKKSE